MGERRRHLVGGDRAARVMLATAHMSEKRKTKYKTTTPAAAFSGYPSLSVYYEYNTASPRPAPQDLTC